MHAFADACCSTTSDSTTSSRSADQRNDSLDMTGSIRQLKRASVVASIACACIAPATAANLGEFDCVIEPHMIVDLASRVDGIVESISVDRGQLVAKDQVLVKLDSGVEEAAVAAARSRASASAALKASSVSVEFAQRRRDRLETLYMDKAVSMDQMDEISTETDLTRLQMQQAQENQRIAELELRQSIEVLQRHTIRSPIDGVVVQRFLSPGESTEDQPILRIAQIDPLRVEVIVPVANFGLIEVGQQAIVSPEAPKQGDYPATVTIVDRVADAASGTFRVRLTMPNSDFALPSGLNCRVRFEPVGALPSNQMAKTTRVSPRITAEQAVRQCQTVGPFSEESAANRAYAALGERAESITKQVKQQEITEGFAILSERQASVAEARALAERLTAAGIVDLFVFDEGANAGLVSLGFYRDRQKALQRQHALEKLGFRSDLKARTSRKAEYWLDVELTPEPEALVLATDPALDGASVATMSCEEFYASRD